ncbi:MAG TPA: SAM-dependent chlorinase/fluorinase [Solirubrobacteraceae bacterium]|nr:SAM-dependent chlorinase/fluorinase [Solirubrobacteraceae bacterium]
MIITFLSDYGLTDAFVGVCHAVIGGVCPDARVIDLSHGVPRGDVRAGALMLSGALPYLPIGVHLAVVDPGVGSERRAVALRTADGRQFVGPDNGLLSLSFEAGGGVAEAVDIGSSPFALQPTSTTFHGRDIFAPVAARLAGGVALGEVGSPCDPGGVVRLELPRASVEDGVLVAHAVYVDRFGNVQLDGVGEAFGFTPGQSVAISVHGESWPGVYGRTFADAGVGELLVYEDSDRLFAVAVNQGSAAGRLGVSVGDELRIALA